MMDLRINQIGKRVNFNYGNKLVTYRWFNSAMPTFVSDSFFFKKTAATLCCIVAGGFLFVACATDTKTADFAATDNPQPMHSAIKSEANPPCIYGQMGKVGTLTDTKPDIQTSEPEVIVAAVDNEPLAERLEELNEQYQEFYTQYMNLLEDMKTLSAVKDKVTNIKLELAGMSAIPKEQVSPLTNTEMIIMNDGTVLRRTISPDPLESSMPAKDRPVDITTLHTTPEKAKPVSPSVTQEPPPETAIVVAKASPTASDSNKEEKEPTEKASAASKPQQPIKDVSVPEEKSVEQALLNGTFLSAVKRVRIGEHPGKKRFVIDFVVGSIIDYKKDVSDKTLTIALSDTAWKGRTEWTSSNTNSPIKSYSVETTDSGSVLHIKLTGSASVDKLFDMPPESPTQGPKLVIDITG